MDGSFSSSLNEFIRWWPLILVIDLIISIACEAAAQWFFDVYHASHKTKHLMWGSVFRISRVINTWIICIIMMYVLTGKAF